MVRLQGDFAKPPEKRFNYKNCFDALFRVRLSVSHSLLPRNDVTKCTMSNRGNHDALMDMCISGFRKYGSESYLSPSTYTMI